MITGRGDIASMLLDNPTRCYFAAGVSNSGEARPAQFEREKWLLLAQPRELRLVYFSSLCVFYADTAYARHKRHMEALVKDTFPKWTIIRLGNITWGRNPHTLINHLRDRFINTEPVTIKDVYRYIVSPEEFGHWIGLIPEWNCELNIPGRRMKVADIYQEFVLDAFAYA